MSPLRGWGQGSDTTRRAPIDLGLTPPGYKNVAATRLEEEEEEELPKILATEDIDHALSEDIGHAPSTGTNRKFGNLG